MNDPLSAAQGDELMAVAALWRATGRQFVTSFLGTSMLPTIAPGVEVTVDCGKAWGVGDVIAYSASGRLIVHRVEGISSDGHLGLTRGDHHIIPDEPFDPRDGVIGVITLVRASNGEWTPPQRPPRSLLRSLALLAVRAGLDDGLRPTRRRVFALRLLASPASIGPLLLARWRRPPSSRP